MMSEPEHPYEPPQEAYEPPMVEELTTGIGPVATAPGDDAVLTRVVDQN
jgi:hypothetical protein